MAADAVKPAPVVAAAKPYNWSGPYLGIEGAAGWGNYSFVYPAGNVGSNSSGGLYGGTLGANWQTPGGKLVFGVEGDDSWAGIMGSASCPNALYSCQSDLQSFATFRGRVGVAMNTWLFYGTAGWAGGSLQAQTTKISGTPEPPSGTPVNGQTLWRNGWTAGIGTELAVGFKLSLKAEWLYFNLSPGNYNVDNGQVIKSGIAGNLVRLGLNWHFWPRWPLIRPGGATAVG